MRLLLQIALLAVALTAAGASAQQLGAVYSKAYANATLAGASAYVSSVNQSGYLVFYPNLTQAYAYLGKAQAAYNSSPAAAVLYADEARSSAEEQYGAMSGYRNLSFAMMAVLTAASAGAVLMSMRKAAVRGRKGGRRGG